MKMNVGMNEKVRLTVSSQLCEFLADTYTLYLKTQNFHWNVTGPSFYPLHLMFEGQYGALAEAVDCIAERIRALGVRAPGTYKEFIKLANVKETTESLSANEMIRQLLADHELIARSARAIIVVAEKAEDAATSDLMAQRIGYHEKIAWMLRSSLEK